MEQPPASNGVREVAEIVEPALRREQEQKEREADLDLELYTKAAEVAQTIRSAVESLYRGEEVIIQDIKRTGEGEYVVKFKVAGEAAPQQVKVRE